MGKAVGPANGGEELKLRLTKNSHKVNMTGDTGI